MLESFRSLRKSGARFQIAEINKQISMSPRSAGRARRIRKLLHFDFLLRALLDLRVEMSVSILVAAPPRCGRRGGQLKLSAVYFGLHQW
jgi:hypothetical protein